MKTYRVHCAVQNKELRSVEISRVTIKNVETLVYCTSMSTELKLLNAQKYVLHFFFILFPCYCFMLKWFRMLVHWSHVYMLRINQSWVCIWLYLKWYSGNCDFEPGTGRMIMTWHILLKKRSDRTQIFQKYFVHKYAGIYPFPRCA